LEEQRERLEKEIESKQEELNGLKVQLDEKIGAKEIEMKDLQSEMEENRQKMFELQKLIEVLEAEKKTLEAALVRKDEEFDEKLSAEKIELGGLLSAKEHVIESQSQEIVSLKQSVENVETKQGEAFKALLHETESIRAELEGFSTLRQEHAAASKNLDAADEKIRSLERTIELLETGRADASTERTETILSRIKNLKDAAKTISEESSEVRNFASSQFSENLKGLQDLGTAFDTLKKSFDLEVSNVIKLLLFVSDKKAQVFAHVMFVRLV
jgi:hypothetical protein